MKVSEPNYPDIILDCSFVLICLLPEKMLFRNFIFALSITQNGHVSKNTRRQNIIVAFTRGLNFFVISVSD